ncbi:unnamed protein product [Rotaria sp. Silwood1]|nr:unnamed protein product [Rotaria sp. Silwood1]
MDTVLETGPGEWELEDHKKKRKKTANVIDDMQKAIPSLAHMALVALQRQGRLKCVISQNCDGLHLRSGLNPTNLAELHGNMNLELCSKCETKYLRDFDTVGIQSHYTGRQCDKRNCRGRLKDSIIDFGEDLPQDALDKAFDHAEQADLCLVLGSSLTVTPAADIPERVVERKQKLVIGNLQRTPLHKVATLNIHAFSDAIMKGIMERLNIPIPTWIVRRRIHVTSQPSSNKQNQYRILIEGRDPDNVDIPYTLFERIQVIVDQKICEDFQPTDWLGAILAPTSSCSADFNEVMKSLISMGIKTNNLVLERDEKNEPQPIEKHLFYGGTRSGDVTATYHQFGQQCPMEFEFFGLQQGKVFGQGDDQVGAFTLAGQYKLKDGYGDINMHKQYVGKHSVIYRGEIYLQGMKCLIEGHWEINNIYDRFIIHLTLPEVYAAEMEKIPLPKASRRQGSKVMISYCPCQYDLAQKIAEGLVAKGISAVCPPLRMHEMIKIATEEARVVIPLMSEAYEASNTSKYVLSYVDEAGIPIVPIKAQDHYSQSSWLGVICAGALWTKITDANDIEKNLDNLIGQLHPYISDSLDEEQHLGALVDGTLVQGYYIQWGKKFDMKFDMFAMIDGYIAGQGDDEVGGFVINGKYICLSDKEDFEFQFKKHYIGQHDVQYSGTITHHESQFFFDGKWFLDDLSDSFHLEVSRNQSSGPKGLHIMLSYQWNSQELVKRVADILKQRNIPIWFDIAGDMKGNINAAMAYGVEGAAMVISFDTVAYSKSINCQKELTYASQLKKNIAPVLLENDKGFQNTWLGTIIASLNAINMQDDNQFNSSIDILVQRINRALEEKKDEDSHRSQVITSLREGRVLGQGNDEIGPFTMAGNYDNEGKLRGFGE